jgi:hypothetical protein
MCRGFVKGGERLINAHCDNVLLNDFNTWAGKDGQLSGEGLIIDKKDHGSLYVRVFESTALAEEFKKSVGKEVNVILSIRKAGNASFVNAVGISSAGK